LNSLSAECVFATEIDKYARKTYEANFKSISSDLFTNGNFATDITKVDAAFIPDFDILCAGFPCQAFSTMGLQKGFEDPRGKLFFEIIRILKAKQPKAFLLENVRNLVSHDGGKTFATILTALQDAGYYVRYKVLKACDYSLPQYRPRVYIVGFRENVPFDFPEPIPLALTLSDVLKGNCEREIAYTLLANGQGTPYGKKRCYDGYNVDGEIRRLSVSEAKQLMGFPESFVFPVSKTQAMKQLGNGVAVPVVRAIAENIINSLDKF